MFVHHRRGLQTIGKALKKDSPGRSRRPEEDIQYWCGIRAHMGPTGPYLRALVDLSGSFYEGGQQAVYNILREKKGM